MGKNNLHIAPNVSYLRIVELTIKIATILLLIFFSIQNYQYSSLFSPTEEALVNTNEKIKRQNEHFHAILTRLRENAGDSRPTINENPPRRSNTTLPKPRLVNLASAFVQAIPKDPPPVEGVKHTNNTIPSYREVYSGFMQARYVIKLDGELVTTVEDVCYAINTLPSHGSSNINSTPIQSKIDSTYKNKMVLTIIGLDGTKNYLPIENTWIQEIAKHEVDIAKWKPGLCDNTIDFQTVGALRKCLKLHLKDYTDVDDPIWTRIDKDNLTKYQKEYNLPIGNTNFETLKSLGFQIFLQYKKNR